ncbi:hypothetical protein NI26_02250 [Curtobacterium sp. MR_MD2014]|nr:hypothetical protein NI26_02250 [Curtobacterium sp. MR_MD2014]
MLSPLKSALWPSLLTCPVMVEPLPTPSPRASTIFVPAGAFSSSSPLVFFEIDPLIQPVVVPGAATGTSGNEIVEDSEISVGSPTKSSPVPE